MSKSKGLAGFLAVALVVVALPAAGQDNGSIEGRVTRSGGQALGGVAAAVPTVRRGMSTSWSRTAIVSWWSL